MAKQTKHTHPQNRLLLEKEPVMKSAGPILSFFEALMAVFVFLVYCLLMFHVVN